MADVVESGIDAAAKAFKRMHGDVCYPSASDGEAKWAAEEIVKAYLGDANTQHVDTLMDEAMKRFWDAEGGNEGGVRAALEFAIETLRARLSQAGAGGGVVVKPLEWTAHPAGGEQAIGAGMARYRIGRNGQNWYLDQDYMGDGGKAAAQADYEARILAALAPSPSAGERDDSTDWYSGPQLEEIARRPEAACYVMPGTIADVRERGGYGEFSVERTDEFTEPLYATPPATPVQPTASVEAVAMTDAQIKQWIEACNHEPARETLRHYLKLRANASSVAAELIAAFKPVIAISDRSHDAWDAAKAAIRKFDRVYPSAPAKGLYGPFGHLVGAFGLDESHWRIEHNPCRDPGYFSLPMFTQVDPFTHLPAHQTPESAQSKCGFPFCSCAKRGVCAHAKSEEAGTTAVVRIESANNQIPPPVEPVALYATPSPSPASAPSPAGGVREAFQQRVQPWMMACFGAEISADVVERNHRFLEEALELVQSTGCTASEAHQLVDYTFSREVGETHQEIGGVMVTLAALCLALGQDMHAAGEAELARIWTKVEKIRAKQAAKPKHSPLPQHVSTPPATPVPPTASVEAVARAIKEHLCAIDYPAKVDIFDPDEVGSAHLHIEGWFDPDDCARAVLASLTPAPTQGDGEPAGWAAVYDGQMKSCHRSRETCIADAQHYQAIHPVFLGPAWRHQED